MSVTITLHLKEVERALNAAERRVLERVGKAIVKEAQARCPRDTGFTAASIGYTAPGQPGPTATSQVVAGRVRRTTAQPAAGNHEIKVFAAADNAVYLEQGTSRMAARPFLQPAVQAVQAQFARIVQDEHL